MSITSTPQAVRSAKLKLEWSVSNMPALEQLSYGRRTRIRPHRVTVTSDPAWGLHISIEGRLLRRDGQVGATNRGIAFTDRSRSPEEAMSNLPAEYLPYVEAGRLMESAR